MNYYKFHLGDYYKKTSHLSMLEDGAYRRLMDAIYLREGPLPPDMGQIYRLARAFTEFERAAVDAVLSEFFTLSDAGYTNARCDEELDSIRSKSVKASQSAAKRHANAHANADANALRTHSEGNASHKPIANSQESSSARAPVTNHHRVVALQLLDRGKTNLSNWERQFLESLCGKASITPKMQETLDSIASKIGVSINATDLMETWRKRLGLARKQRQWDAKWGPMPGDLGCLVPDELLTADDGKGWAAWKPTPHTNSEAA